MRQRWVTPLPIKIEKAIVKGIEIIAKVRMRPYEVNEWNLGGIIPEKKSRCQSKANPDAIIPEIRAKMKGDQYPLPAATLLKKRVGEIRAFLVVLLKAPIIPSPLSQGDGDDSSDEIS